MDDTTHLTFESVADLLAEFTGKQRVIPVYIQLIDLTGDITSAVFLAQCLYWSARKPEADGWFWKTHEQWFEEVRLSPKQVRRCVQACGGMVEVDLRGVPARNFYRVNRALFIQRLVATKGNIKLLPKVTTSNALPSETSRDQREYLYSKITAEPTATNTAAAGRAPEEAGQGRAAAANSGKVFEPMPENQNPNGQAGKSAPSLDNVQGDAGNTNATDLENVPGAAAARAALEKCFSKPHFLEELLAEYEDRALWLKLAPDFIEQTRRECRQKHGRKWTTVFIERLDNAARQFTPQAKSANKAKSERVAVESAIDDILGV